MSNKHKEELVLEAIDYPWIMSINLDLRYMKKPKGHSVGGEYDLNPHLYGKRLDRHTYFVLFKGMITPKICEDLSRGKPYRPKAILNFPLETECIKLSTFLNHKAAENIEISENSKEESETQSTSAESTTDSNLANVDSQIVKFINSDVFSDATSQYSEDCTNTVNF